MDQSKQNEASQHPRDGDSEPPRTTRRAFLRGAAKKAIYVAPAIVTFTASQAQAGSAPDFDSGCIEAGSVNPCTVDGDCCNGALTCNGSGDCV